MEQKPKNSVDRAMSRAYNKEFLPAVVGYVVIMMVLNLAVDFESAGRWKYLVALLPLVPALYGIRAVGRHVRRVDEMQRDILLRSMAAGFGLAMVASLTIGFLSMAGLDTDTWSPWVIYSAGMAGWGVVGMSNAAREG